MKIVRLFIAATNLEFAQRTSFKFSRPINCQKLFFREMSTKGETANAPKTASGSNSIAEDVIIHKIDTKRVIALNRPKSLNALNLSMIRKIYPQLKKYNEDPSVNLIIMKGEGDKSFCAGGDVRAICEARHSNSKLSEEFFREEYKLNYLIGTLQKPYIALIDGITMGGGVGLSVHGMYRVATERTVFAMPECQIGLFPDVGGTHFLPRLPGKLGYFLALTGHRLKGREVLEAGIATHFVESSMLKDLEKQLLILKAESVNKSNVGALLTEFSLKSRSEAREFSLKPHLNKINSIFNVETVEEVIRNLIADESDWSKKVAETLSKMSPTSLKITMHALKLGAEMSLKECLEMEYRLTQRCCEDDDLYSGISAVLIERHNNPKWIPESLDQVTQRTIERYFSRLPDSAELNLVT